MKQIFTRRFLAFSFILLLTIISYSQNTEKLFSQKGLKFVVDVFDDTNQFMDGSVFYIGDTIVNNNTFLIYETKYGGHYYLYIDEAKVYNSSLNLTYKKLLFDFNLNVADTFYLKDISWPGITDTLLVQQKSITQLIDNKDRIYIKLKHHKFNWSFEWIEGIGYKESGLFLYTNSNAELICVSEENELLLKGKKFEEEKCNSRSCRQLISSFTINGSNNKIELTNNSKNSESNVWDFGDGNTSTDNNVSYEFADKDCYRIQLKAKNKCGEEVYSEQYYNYCIDSSWVKINSINFVEVSFINETLGWGITKEGIFHTIDGGLNWISQSLPPKSPSTKIQLHTIHMTNSNIGVIVNVSNGYPNLLITKDGGLNWNEVAAGIGNICFAKITENGICVIASNSKVAISYDFGVTWKLSNKPNSFTSKYFNFNNNIIEFVGRDFGGHILPSIIQISYDIGETWKEIVFENKYQIDCSHFINQDIGFAAGRNFILKTVNGGNTWKEVIEFKNYQTFHSIDFSDSLNGIAVSNNYILLTVDGGETWDIEYCQNKNTINHVDLIGSSSFISMLNGFYVRQPNPDFNCTTSIEEISQNEIEIYPNPATDILNIKLNQSSFNNARFYDLLGRCILKCKLDTEQSIDLSYLKNGMYLLHFINDKNEFIVKTFIKQ